jgi:hypothetical protein
MDLIIRVCVVLVIAWLIMAYLIPLLPAPFAGILLVVLVICIILWLMKTAGLWF